MVYTHNRNFYEWSNFPVLNTLKALIVILPAIIGVFVLARFVLRDHIEPKRVDIWLMIFGSFTVMSFLISNYWIMIVLLMLIVLLLVALKIEPNLPALFALLICVMPPQVEELRGIAGINYLFPISPPLILSLAILTPAVLFFKKMSLLVKGVRTTDIFMYAFVLLAIVLSFRDTTFTDGLRGIWNVSLTIFLPYFIFSRWIKTFADLKIVIIAILLPLLSMAVMAFPEAVLKWHFYAIPSANWHGPFAAPYTYRAGFLRAYGSVMGPIELGFLLMITLTLAYALLAKNTSKIIGFGGIGAMMGALLLTFSRGPWAGAMLSTFMYIVSGPKGMIKGMIAGFVGLIALGILIASPIGDNILSVIPFVDSGEVQNEQSSTISYRQKILENGIAVVKQYPFFGYTKYYLLPEIQSLVQGQGLIDIVNSYLQIALEKGLVGLFFFVGILLSATFAAWRAMRLALSFNEDLSVYARAMFGAMVGVIFVIGTTSSISQVPFFYWMMAGLCVSTRRMVAFEMQNRASAPAASPVDAPLSVRAAREQQAASRQDAESLALARKNAARKQAAQSRNVPAHLRQYVREKPDRPS